MHLTDNGKVYAWQQLTERAGLNDLDAITFNYGDPALAPAGERVVTVIPCDRHAGEALLQLPPRSLDWLPVAKVLPPAASLPFCDPIPVPFWGERSRDSSPLFAELVSRQHVVFHVDIIAATFFMLTRWEETVSPVKDEHDRFPATASVAYRQGFLSRPIIDEYALILRAWLRVLLPDWQPQAGEFSVKLSHDIDHLRQFPGHYSALRTLAHYLVKQYNPRKAVESLREALIQTVAPSCTAFVRGIHALMRISQQFGFNNDAFYFMSARPSPRENEYTIASPLVRTLVREIQKEGFEIGLHAGYHSARDPQALRAQRDRLANLLGETQFGGRQHYLRFHAPGTWRNWEEAELSYDATLGYADHEGFRGGTCRRYQPFDCEQDRRMRIWEEPLVAMDGTLRSARNMTPAHALERVKDLADRCRWAEGTFTLLWHNSSLSGEWTPWVQTYCDMTQYLGGLSV